MFEKSLYDLIRGLRNHKGNERAYIQASLRECRREIKSQDMDLKAIALLKLAYLEMFGHDMSWASFNVLEVMSSQKYPQKRVGYLAAVQSFRPDTEVLMLAENLLKKDLSSPMPPTIGLPLISIPHVISAPMANSLLSDLLPRLSHSHPGIRKKAVVTLYRLALVFPETLRPAWPRIKERLMDEDEDASVTAAVVNVVCELGSRRPADFLPLAPRLFELLVDGSNNWMAIKIIKLFAKLTPLEPRLVKKLLSPLITIIKTTPAMSLLYECINGVIGAGILDTASGTTEGDEIARLCVSKLRGMLVIEGDPNLKYVALLAFNKIVESHPYLVALQEDAILECIDDPDISIRLRALDLAVGMVNAQNLTTVVERLLKQLRSSPLPSSADDPSNDRGASEGIEPMADFDDEEHEQSLQRDSRSKQPPPLPDDYRMSIIQKILDMCSISTYANIDDFSWYIEVLVSLVRHAPPSSTADDATDDVSHAIGSELRNVAVRVKSARHDAVRAAEALISPSRRAALFPSIGNGGQSVHGPAVWVVGEFCSVLDDARATLGSLLHPQTATLPSPVLAAHIQAVMKLVAHIETAEWEPWNAERKTMTSLRLSRVIAFLEPLAAHPALDVQEPAAQYLELVKLAAEAAASQSAEPDASGSLPAAPLLLTQALPSLFTGPELNPIAPEAQRRVPVPPELDLDAPINPHLSTLLSIPRADTADSASADDPAFHAYYYERPTRRAPTPEPAAARLALSSESDAAFSYQNAAPGPASDRLDPESAAAAAARRRARQANDPFYIAGSAATSGRATPELDIDAIPIMPLDLEGGSSDASTKAQQPAPARKKKPARAVEILGDESLDSDAPGAPAKKASSSKRGLLQVDSSLLDRLSLSERAAPGPGSSVASPALTAQPQVQPLDVERRTAEEAEMAAALAEVERLRAEMARAQARVGARAEEASVSKKRRKGTRAAEIEGAGQVDGAETAVRKKKKKVKKSAVVEGAAEDAAPVDGPDGEATTKPKKKKKKRVAQVEEAV